MRARTTARTVIQEVPELFRHSHVLRRGVVAVSAFALLATSSAGVFAATPPGVLYPCFDSRGNVRMTDRPVCLLPGGRLVAINIQGPIGPRGLAGATGARGLTGATGARGATGLTGPVRQRGGTDCW